MIVKFLKENYQRFLMDKCGSAMLFVMVFGSIALSLIVVGLSSYAIFENTASNKKFGSEMALQIASAGINYYRWHLVHNNTDYYDGNATGTPGPFVHNYTDKDGTIIGTYSLTVTPPATGTTIVVIQSDGVLKAQPTTHRIIRARVGFPSLSDFAIVQNDGLWLTGDVFGKVWANGGIRFDGTAHNQIMSAVPSFTCSSLLQGCNHIGDTNPGIWGSGSPTTSWQFPVPAADLSGIGANVAQVKSAALASSVNDGRTTFPYLFRSGLIGWELQFLPNGTVNVFQVKACTQYPADDINSNNNPVPANPVPCLDDGVDSDTQIGNGYLQTYNIPANGFIYVDGNLWIRGTIRGRVTVANSPGNFIVINGDIKYVHRDGSDILGLISDTDIFLRHDVPNTADILDDAPNSLTVDGVLVAKNGTFKRYDYENYGGAVFDNFNLFGSVILNKAGFLSRKVNGVTVSGFRNESYVYDANLVYGPPPGFFYGSQYELKSWDILK